MSQPAAPRSTTAVAPTTAALLLAAALLAAAPAAAQPPSEEPSSLFIERVDVNVVNVEVFVTDRDGNHVIGLERDDFEIVEDGEPVEISNFYTVEWQDALLAEPAAEGGLPAARRETPPDQRLHLVVYVDHATLSPVSRRQVLEALEGFLEDRLIEGDQVMLVSYHRTLEVVEPFTRDLGRIAAALGTMSKETAYGPIVEAQRRQTMRQMAQFAQGGDPDDVRNAYNFVRSYVQQRESDVRREARAMEKVVRSMAVLPGRKALLYVGGGLPQRPGEELYQYLSELVGSIAITGASTAGQLIDTSIEALSVDQSHVYDAITRAANSNQVTLYTFDAAGLSGVHSVSAEHDTLAVGIGVTGGTTVAALRRHNLQEPLIHLAETTGGTAVLNSSNFADALTRMANDFDTYYSLGYVSPGAGDGKFHRIDVRLKRPGLAVRHRTGYVDKPQSERVADRTLSSLLLDLESNPLAVEVVFGEPQRYKRDRFRLPVLVRIPFSEVTLVPVGDQQEGRLNIYLAVKDDKGGVSDLHTHPYPVKIPADQLAAAKGQDIGYYATLELRPGRPRVAVGVWDELSGRESFVQKEVRVEETATGQKSGR